MSRTIRWSATVLVCACLTAGAAQAWPLAQGRPDFAVPELGSRLEAAWGWLVSLFSEVKPKPDPAHSTSPRKSSCSSDPFGHPVCS
jgi:hypothetical protein